MTAEQLLENIINIGEANKLSASIDKEFIKEIMKKHELNYEELLGLVCRVVLLHHQEAIVYKDKADVLEKRYTATKNTLDQLIKDNQLSAYKVRNLKQRNGLTPAKKYSENKFKMCIEMGADKHEIMQTLGISESTYYRLLRSYKASLTQS